MLTLTLRARTYPIVFSLLACSLADATAADLIVSKFDDSNDGVCNADCSLREAVHHANMTFEADRILLAAGTYALTLGGGQPEESANLAGDLDVMFSDLTIIGAGMRRTLIDGGQFDRLFDVSVASTLRLEQLTLSNGRTSGFGGALRNRGTLELEHVWVKGSAVLADIGAGGAIANYGDLSVSSSFFDDNQTHASDGSGEGGAIYNNRAGTLLVRNSRFTGNISYDDFDTGRGAAIYNEGIADIARSAFIGNKGGEYGNGSAILNAEGGDLTLSNSTISGNVGYYSYGTFANGQFGSRNNPTTTARLVNVTIADNEGVAALYNLGVLEVRNSIVAGNYQIPDEGPRRPANCRSAAGATLKSRGMLLGTHEYGCTADMPINDNLAFTQVLEPLDSSLTVPIHPLKAGSLAIDAGVGSCTQTDQRKVARPQDGDGDGSAGCDLGAYERAAP
ncbi:choice-of-anchor Q domain-containing protein [Pseudomonas borbori]